MIGRLKSEAERVRNSALSPFFSAVMHPGGKADIRLSPAQLENLLQLDRMGREIVEDWLVRDVDAGKPVATARLIERLSTRGSDLQSRIKIHFDAIAQEGVLTATQRDVYRASLGRKAIRTMGTRSRVMQREAGGGSTSETLRDALREKALVDSRCGKLMYVVLGEPGIKEAYPNGIDHLDPVGRQLARHGLPKVDVPRRQAELAERLDRLMVGVFRAWLVRDLDKEPLPSPSSLLARVDESERLRDILSDHASAIVLMGLLSPDEAERCLAQLWRQDGTRALVDPTLASRLKLTKSQRSSISLLIANRDLIEKEIGEAQISILGLVNSDPDVHRLGERLSFEGAQRIELADEAIWEVLKSSQIRQLKRILNGTTSASPPTAPKR